MTVIVALATKSENVPSDSSDLDCCVRVSFGAISCGVCDRHRFARCVKECV